MPTVTGVTVYLYLVHAPVVLLLPVVVLYSSALIVLTIIAEGGLCSHDMPYFILLPHRTVMDEWECDLRASVVTGCDARCSPGVVWRGTLQLQEQLEVRSVYMYIRCSSSFSLQLVLMYAVILICQV